jgi:hypothetical protein
MVAHHRSSIVLGAFLHRSLRPVVHQMPVYRPAGFMKLAQAHSWRIYVRFTASSILEHAPSNMCHLQASGFPSMQLWVFTFSRFVNDSELLNSHLRATIIVSQHRVSMINAV